MSPITHFLAGWAVANTVPPLTRRERALVTWAGVLPDLDGLGIIAEMATRNSAHPLTWWSDYHHVLGHNLGFAMLITVFAAVFSRHKWVTAVLVLVSFHLHFVGDLMGARGPDGDQWPIPYLLPFSNHLQLTWTGKWALNAWPNVVITGALIVAALRLAVRRGYSPVELFSTKADRRIIETLRNRVP